MKLYNIIKTLILGACFFLIFSCKKDSNDSIPNVNNLKLDPDSATANTLLTLTGSDLGGIYKIYFEKDSVPVSFNPNFNTNNALLFRVPDTASGGEQNIVFVKSNGLSFKVPFKVIATATISAVSNYDFIPGDTILLTGNNLDDVSSVVISGTSDQAKIINQDKKTLQIIMPNTQSAMASLDITNASGVFTTSQQFANINNAYTLFTDNYENGMTNNSWGVASISSDVYKTGKSSFKAIYGKGGWNANGLANWSSGIPNLQSAGYKYMTFWIKGASEDYQLYLTASTKAAGYGNADKTTTIKVSAGVWNYFKLSLDDLKLWSTGNNCNAIGWWIEGPNDQDETFYFDDIMFVK